MPRSWTGLAPELVTLVQASFLKFLLLRNAVRPRGLAVSYLGLPHHDRTTSETVPTTISCLFPAAQKVLQVSERNEQGGVPPSHPLPAKRVVGRGAP